MRAANEHPEPHRAAGSPVRPPLGARLGPTAALAVGAAVPAGAVGLLALADDPTRLRPSAVLLAIVAVVCHQLGTRAGIAAAAVSEVGLAVVVVEPHGSLRVEHGTDVVGLVLFGLAAAIIVRLVASLGHERRRLVDAQRVQARSVDLAERLLEAADAVAAATSRAEVARAVALTGVETGAAWTSVATRVDDPPRLRFEHVSVRPGETARAWPDIPLEAGWATAQCVRDGRPIFVLDRADRDARWPDAPSDPRRRSWAYVPLSDGTGPAFGVVALAYDEPQPFDAEQRSFLLSLAWSASQALARLAASERAELERVVGALDHMLDGTAILSAVRDAAGAVVDFDIVYLNPANRTEQGWVRLGDPRTTLSARYPALVGTAFTAACIEAVERQRPVILDAFEFPSDTTDNPVPDMAVVQVAPFADGVLVVTHDDTERARADRELRASQRLNEAAQRLARIGSWRWDAATGVFEMSPEMLRIVGFDEDGPPPSYAELARRIHPDDRRPLRDLIERVGAEERFRFEERIFHPDGSMVHVVVHGEAERGPAPPGAPATLGPLLAWWGTFQDVTQQRAAEEEVVRQHATVTLLQRAILPLELPEVPGVQIDACYRPAGDGPVGGDWYDVFPLADGALALVVGDVAGHGVASAATMAALRNGLRAYLWQGLGPSEALWRLDDFAGGTAAGTFATVVVATYDAGSHLLRWASAGHPPPLAVVDGVPRLLEAPAGVPLGVEGGPVTRFEEAKVVLGPGSALVLYSDGLVERRGEVLDAGLARLADLVCARLATAGDGPLGCVALVDGMVERAPRDDVCVVTLRVDA